MFFCLFYYRKRCASYVNLCSEYTIQHRTYEYNAYNSFLLPLLKMVIYCFIFFLFFFFVVFLFSSFYSSTAQWILYQNNNDNWEDRKKGYQNIPLKSYTVSLNRCWSNCETKRKWKCLEKINYFTISLFSSFVLGKHILNSYTLKRTYEVLEGVDDGVYSWLLGNFPMRREACWVGILLCFQLLCWMFGRHDFF